MPYTPQTHNAKTTLLSLFRVFPTHCPNGTLESRLSQRGQNTDKVSLYERTTSLRNAGDVMIPDLTRKFPVVCVPASTGLDWVRAENRVQCVTGSDRARDYTKVAVVANGQYTCQCVAGLVPASAPDLPCVCPGGQDFSYDGQTPVCRPRCSGAGQYWGGDPSVCRCAGVNQVSGPAVLDSSGYYYACLADCPAPWLKPTADGRDCVPTDPARTELLTGGSGQYYVAFNCDFNNGLEPDSYTTNGAVFCHSTVPNTIAQLNPDNTYTLLPYCPNDNLFVGAVYCECAAGYTRGTDEYGWYVCNQDTNAQVPDTGVSARDINRRGKPTVYDAACDASPYSKVTDGQCECGGSGTYPSCNDPCDPKDYKV